MGSVRKLADEVGRGLAGALPGLRKTVAGKLALAVGAMIEGRTPNTVDLANLLPLGTERQDMREQWLRRLLRNPLLDGAAVMAPFARAALAGAARHGRTVLLAMDQTDLGDRMALLMVALRVGDRALPLAWLAEAGPANIGFEGQRELLERVEGWLPPGVTVVLSADRFYPSVALFAWVRARGWGYRLRLKGNVLADTGQGEETTTGQLAQGVPERYLPGVRLFAQGAMTNLGILHETGHPEPWIIAMDCPPTRAAVLDYAARWAIEICHSQPVKIAYGRPVGHGLWFRRIRTKPGGKLKREQIIGVDPGSGHHHLVDEATDHGLAVLERQFVEAFAQQVAERVDMGHDPLPMDGVLMVPRGLLEVAFDLA